MKSECSEYQNKIARSFLGDQSAGEKQALEEHLASCSSCRSEQANYAQTLDLLKGAGEEPVPRHFFVHEKEQIPDPWQLFWRMRPAWRAATAAVAGLFLLISIAVISRLQIRHDRSGWAMSFGGAVDIAALKEDILKTAAARNRAAGNAWLQEVRAEIEQSNATLAQQQRAYIETELLRLDSRFKQNTTRTEGNVRADTREMIADLSQTISQQRAQDLGVMNLRFDSIEANNVIKARQTNNILDTLLQVAELRLK